MQITVPRASGRPLVGASKELVTWAGDEQVDNQDIGSLMAVGYCHLPGAIGDDLRGRLEKECAGIPPMGKRGNGQISFHSN